MVFEDLQFSTKFWNCDFTCGICNTVHNADVEGEHAISNLQNDIIVNCWRHSYTEDYIKGKFIVEIIKNGLQHERLVLSPEEITIKLQELVA